MQSSCETVPVAQQALIGLHQLPLHQWATVYSLDAKSHTDTQILLRLSEIGFVPGEDVCTIAAGMPGHEPLAVRVGESTFALRRNEAALVQVIVHSESRQ